MNLKMILKEAVNDIIPENLLNATKRGFGFGITEKNVLQGPWKENAQKILNNFPDNTFIDPIKVKKLWNPSSENHQGPWDQII